MATVKWISGEHQGQVLEGNPTKTSSLEKMLVELDDGRVLSVMSVFTAGPVEATRLKMSVAEGVLETDFKALVGCKPR